MILPFPQLSLTQPARYRILVQGRLGEGWEDWFEGMCLTRLELRGEQWLAETTLLKGIVPDQAALLGMLQRLYAFGLPILKVELISQDDDRFEQSSIYLKGEKDEQSPANPEESLKI